MVYHCRTRVWTEYEVPAGALTLKFGNASSDTMALEETGYLLTSTEIPLADPESGRSTAKRVSSDARPPRSPVGSWHRSCRRCYS